MSPPVSAAPAMGTAKTIESPDFNGCTALVLGAGASRPYGFPIGKELVKEICDQFLGFFEAMKAYGGTCCERRAKAEHFVRRLSDSTHSSIDDFLESNTDLLHLGKIAIASCLLPREDESELLRTKDWYEALFDWWCEEPMKLAVITFNYERSFEHWFWLTLNERFGPECARDIMLINDTQRIIIDHVHGHFGDLPWRPGDYDKVPYGLAPNEDLGERVMEAARQLRLVFEPPSDRALAGDRPLLILASRVLFLGFGYDQRNLERIEPIWSGRNLCPTAEIFGTAYDPGGPTGQLARKAEQLLPQWAGSDWHGELKVVPKKVIEAIKEPGRLGS
ncbi:MAG TPA: hypothetical protein VNE39_26960 [Planctomycetota bacterium]|nr:hypothetical protein [Planctomycetota bacterium]